MKINLDIDRIVEDSDSTIISVNFFVELSFKSQQAFQLLSQNMVDSFNEIIIQMDFSRLFFLKCGN